MAVDAITSPMQAPRDTANPGYRIEGDKVVNDEFLDGFTFWDALDVINPLQHIPLVNTVYRELTDDQIKSGPRLAGGLLFGGIAGLAGAAINVLSKELTGKDLGEHAIALVDMAIHGEEEVRTAQIDAPSGQASSAQALDPNAPLDLLPPRWRMAASGGMGPAALGGGSVTTQGTAPTNLPLGDGALFPPGEGSISPAVSPTKPTPGSVDVILPQRADASSSPQRGAQVAGRAPVNPPLGDDALGAPALAKAETAALQTDTATSRQPRSLSETKEFSGRSLSDYRNRPVRFNAGRSTHPTASDATAPARLSAQASHPDPAAMARLLEAQASARSPAMNTALDSTSEGTSEGDVLRVAEPGSGTGIRSPATATYDGGDIKPEAWFAQKMMMGLEKYQKAHGGVPLSRSADIDA